MSATATREMNYVNLYFVDRLYAGAEEGGWWYDTGKFVSCLGKNLDPAAARIIRDAHQNELDDLNVGRRPVSSVLSTGMYEIHIEPNAGEDYPRYRPRYE